jgi:hypothetical protein
MNYSIMKKRMMTAVWVLAVCLTAMVSCTTSRRPHDEQGAALLHILNADHASLVVLNNDSLSIHTDRGVQDLLRLLREEPERLHGAQVADKIVGRAAASLMVAGGVSEVHTNLISTPALNLLREAGIPVSYDEEVPQILNRDRSGQCPIDSRLNDAETVNECVTILQAGLAL